MWWEYSSLFSCFMISAGWLKCVSRSSDESWQMWQETCGPERQIIQDQDAEIWRRINKCKQHGREWEPWKDRRMKDDKQGSYYCIYVLIYMCINHVWRCPCVCQSIRRLRKWNACLKTTNWSKEKEIDTGRKSNQNLLEIIIESRHHVLSIWSLAWLTAPLTAPLITEQYKKS